MVNGMRSMVTESFRRVKLKSERKEENRKKESAAGREDTKIRMDGTDIRKREKPPDVK